MTAPRDRSDGAIGRAHVLSDGRWLRFDDPVEIVTTGEGAEVDAALRYIEGRVENQGLHAVGYLAYHAGAAYHLDGSAPAGVPALWFGLFDGAVETGAPEASAATAEPPDGDPWIPGVHREAYLDALTRIRGFIRSGETYQVNFTFPLRSRFRGDPASLFARLVPAQNAEYAAFVETADHAILSLSPELFFRLDGDTLVSKPMKGTARRGITTEDDDHRVTALRNSEKDLAENRMIVDMIRNDMGRVSQVGSVVVDALFDVERYPTLLQMTSTVRSRCDRSIAEIVAAMFPCASVTGAPKKRTMEIIAEVEESPRGIYTGAVGTIGPGRRARFSVAIRTLVIDKDTGAATYGVGSGVTVESDPEAEYAECLLKGDILTRRAAPFRLLETLLWTPGEGFFLLNEHLERLADSARFFGISVDAAALRYRLHAAVAGAEGASRIRLLVDRRGEPALEVFPIDGDGAAGGLSVVKPMVQSSNPPPANPVRVGLSTSPVDSAALWLYHKTTRREIYEEAAASRPESDDVLLWNERGEITESTIANVVLRRRNRLVTPPVSCGLLPGVFRRRLLEEGTITEEVVPTESLGPADEIWLVNSVRGWRRARLTR